MTGVMNNTKWEELRLGMYNLNDLSPQWRTRDLESGYVSQWDREWYYHFRTSGYKTIEWVEIKVDTEEQEKAVFEVIKKINLPGERINIGYRIYGYAPKDKQINYIDL